MSGWIKSHRKMATTSWYRKPLVHALAHHLILTAHWQESKTILKKQEKVVEVGQVITSQKELSKETGLTRAQLRNSLEILSNTGFIAIETTKEGSIITIKKYTYYQDLEKDQPSLQPDSNQITTNEQPDSNHRLRIKDFKEVKELKEKTLKTTAATQSEACKIYRSTFRYNPTKIQAEEIDATVITELDLKVWDNSCRAWALCGNKPTNVNGILEWFKTGTRSNYSRPTTKQTPQEKDDVFKKLREKINQEKELNITPEVKLLNGIQ